MNIKEIERAKWRNPPLYLVAVCSVLLSMAATGALTAAALIILRIFGDPR